MGSGNMTAAAPAALFFAPLPMILSASSLAALSLACHRTQSAFNAGLLAILREYGMTLTHWRVMCFLAEHGDRSVTALAAETGHDQTTLSRALTVMETAHWVQRRATVQDHRVVAISLLKEGRRLFRKALPQVTELERLAFDGLSAADQRLLGDMLERIRGNLDPA